MSFTHGYLVPEVLAKGHLGEQDLNEQIREEAYTDAWEMSLSDVQDMMVARHGFFMKRLIDNLVEKVAWAIIVENNDVE